MARGGNMNLCNYNYNILGLALARNKKPYINESKRVYTFSIMVDWNEWPYFKIEIILPKDFKNIISLLPKDQLKELEENPPLKNQSFRIFDTYYLSPAGKFLKLLFWKWYI
jgi:hypothetical protein